MFKKNFLSELIEISYEAGVLIMDIYNNKFEVNHKNDNSPVTNADRIAEKFILKNLNNIFPEIPVISEEAYSNKIIPNYDKKIFLVDPLDGTKEFIKKNGEFTVNIAFIDEGFTKIGIINAPAKNKIFFNDEEKSYVIEAKSKNEVSIQKAKQIKVSDEKQKNLIATISRSHNEKETENYLENYDIDKIKYIGSSYKFCLIASGEAHIYPRMSPTCEWDTAAGHAILKTAGGNVTLLNGEELRYGFKENNFINPYFIASNKKII